jgi:small subunit ribosomal protein S11
MGKKKIIKQTEEDFLKQGEKEEIKTTVKGTAKRGIREARVYISSSFNNTIINLTDNSGNVLGWTSAGTIGFKGTKKSTPYAASKVAEVIADLANRIGVEKVAVYVKGVGSGRESAIRSLLSRGLDVYFIKDMTPVPHNGCRQPKARRV